MKKNLLIPFVFLSVSIFGQEEDLLKMVEESQPKKSEKVFATFKTTRINNAQSIETVKAKTMDFRITHRFGNIGANSNGGVHTLYGLDNVSDVRISFDFGITDKIQLGFGRSTRSEMLDGSVKWRFLEQTVDNKVPLTLCFFGDMLFSPVDKSILYSGTSNVTYNIAHRVSYVSQLLIARKFNSWLSLELLPTYHHRNFIKMYVNADNAASETNDLFAIGAGGRIKITNRMAILFDYFYTFSQYRQSNTANPYYMPLSIGFEIETGGHVFHLNFTNAVAINEGYFIPNSPDSWLKGGFKFGFNISRVFNL